MAIPIIRELRKAYRAKGEKVGREVPSTLLGVRTSHSVSIKVEGTKIGMIQSWVPSQSRSVVPHFELNAATDGRVAGNIPGNIGGLTINVTRYDLYRSKMEEVWGGLDLHMLTDQSNPLTIKERWDYEDGSTETWAYTGCWFTSLGRNLAAQGDRIVNVNATLAYARRYKMDEDPASLGDAFNSLKNYFRGF